MRKGGFEPPRLSAPPPQDGVSASSTTSAFAPNRTVNVIASSDVLQRKGPDGLRDCATATPALAVQALGGTFGWTLGWIFNWIFDRILGSQHLVDAEQVAL